MPEELKSISTESLSGFDSDSLFYINLINNVDNNVVYCPKSLLEINENIFIGKKVQDIRLNEGLKYPI